MLHRFLPLAALIYVSVSLPAHAQAQQRAAGAVRGRIVDSLTGRVVPTATVLMRSQRVHGTGEADTAGGPRIHARRAFMATAPSSRSRSS